MTDILPVNTEFLAYAFAMPAIQDVVAAPPPAPEGMPKEINGQPVEYRWRKVVRDGLMVHPQKKWRLWVTPGRRAGWEKTFREMKADGIPIPVVKDHEMSSDATIGYVVDVRNTGEWWEELHQYIGADSLDVATKNHLSMGLRLMNVGGTGKVYGEGMFHCATTPIPVQVDQPLEMAASSALHDFDSLHKLAYSIVEDKKMTFDFSDEQLAELKDSLGLTDPVTPENLLAACKGYKDRMASAVTASKAVASGKAIIVDNVGDLELDGDGYFHYPKVDGGTWKVKVSSPKDFMASAIVKGETASDRKEMFSERLSLLVEKGKITPASKSKIEKLGEVLVKVGGEFLASAEVDGVGKDARLDKMLLEALSDLPVVLEASQVVTQTPPVETESNEQLQVRLGKEMASRYNGGK